MNFGKLLERVIPLASCRFLKPQCFRRFCSSVETTSSSSNTAEMNRAKLENMRPSEEFLKKLSPEERKHAEKVYKELEVYVWMSDYSPCKMTEVQWSRLLECTSLISRVQFLDFLTDKEYKTEKEAAKKRSTSSEPNESVETTENEDRTYKPILNPLRSSKSVRLWRGAKVLQTMRMDTKPHIVLDMQYVSSMEDRGVSMLGNQGRYLIEDNFLRRQPFLISFANFDAQATQCQRMMKFIGYYDAAYQHQTILPTVTQQGIRDLYPNNDDIVYISNFAGRTLDGPLRKKVYVICFTFDRKRESLGAARSGRFNVARFPFQKYIEWTSGNKLLPITTQIKILHDAYHLNGDWKTAFMNNISKRHLRSEEEQPNAFFIARENRKMKRHKLQTMVHTILEATGGTGDGSER